MTVAEIKFAMMDFEQEDLKAIYEHAVQLYKLANGKKALSLRSIFPKGSYVEFTLKSGKSSAGRR